MGPWGAVCYAVLYIVAMMLLLPGTPFTIGAAILFGSLWGFVTMLSATTAAAMFAFLFSRYLAREKIEKQLDGQETIESLKGWVEKNYWLAIPFVRIMPLFPFAVNNYALGLTKIGFWKYLLSSLVVFIPMTAVLVLGANALYGALVRGEISWNLTIGTVIAGVIILSLGAVGKRVLE